MVCRNKMMDTIGSRSWIMTSFETFPATLTRERTIFVSPSPDMISQMVSMRVMVALGYADGLPRLSRMRCKVLTDMSPSGYVPCLSWEGYVKLFSAVHLYRSILLFSQAPCIPAGSLKVSSVDIRVSTLQGVHIPGGWGFA